MDLDKRDDDVVQEWLRTIDAAGKFAVKENTFDRRAELHIAEKKLNKSYERERNFIAEIAQIKASVERYRRDSYEQQRTSSIRVEASEARLKYTEERLRNLNEDRSNTRARLANLEDTIRDNAPTNVWERMKAAVGVFLGLSSVVPALPESIHAQEKGDLKKAA